jgi:hypothetical protein
VITPTLLKEKLAPNVLFQHREKLIRTADAHEEERFQKRLEAHDNFRTAHEDNEIMNPEAMKRIGFKRAKKVMREIMLKDTPWKRILTLRKGAQAP